MSSPICYFCGNHVSREHVAADRCDMCEPLSNPLPPVGGIDDSELGALRAEVARLKKENEALKRIERQRWENVNKAFGTAYSTERSNELMNLPMNVNDFGTRRPGDF